MEDLNTSNNTCVQTVDDGFTSHVSVPQHGNTQLHHAEMETIPKNVLETPIHRLSPNAKIMTRRNIIEATSKISSPHQQNQTEIITLDSDEEKTKFSIKLDSNIGSSPKHEGNVTGSHSPAPMQGQNVQRNNPQSIQAIAEDPQAIQPLVNDPLPGTTNSSDADLISFNDGAPLASSSPIANN